MGVGPAVAQSVESIVGEMQARHERQLAEIDNYIVETNLSTSYYRKVTRDGRPTFEVTTRMRDGSPIFGADTGIDTGTQMIMGPAFLDRLAQHATYAGTATIDGKPAHTLRVNDPSALRDEVGDGVEELTYHVDAEQYVPVRVVAVMASRGGQQQPTMTMNMSDYRTVEGLTLPYSMTMQMDLGLSEKERRRMEQMRKKMQNMSEQQREQMKRMMGGRFERMQKMMQGEPTTMTVQSVRVNEGLPDGIFGDGGGR